ncbi:transporter [Pelotalea chapellei]|uniref:Transporter n=1 Tax=Pelotalea chapellei TaxID=44671 RepID=A0ABS5UAB9_9BACT|nr:transporter [Pelotalea chapellei]MBT1072626.1 transporter [Pelotalea chapellei]
MLRISRFFTSNRTTAITLACLTMTAFPAFAGPPLATDDAGTVDVGKVEVELNGAYTADRERTHGITTKCNTSDAEMKVTTGFYKNLGISVAIPYTISDRIREDNRLVGKTDGFGDMTVEVKYAFLELAGTTFAIKPVIIIPTGKYSAGLSEGRWQLGGTLIATKEFNEGKYALHANLGYEHHSYRTEAIRATTRGDFWSGSIAGEMEVAKGMFAVADFGLATTADKSISEPCAYALTGARYQLNDHLDVNAGIKFGLTRPEADVTALYGVVLKF